MSKHENLIIAILGLLYAILLMIWPEADFSKTQFLATGLTLLAIVATASNIRDVLTGIANRYDLRKEALALVRLLEASGVKLTEDQKKILVALAGGLDDSFQTEPQNVIETMPKGG